MFDQLAAFQSCPKSANFDNFDNFHKYYYTADIDLTPNIAVS